MIIPPGPLRVLVAAKPVDFRKGVDGLAALVKERCLLAAAGSYPETRQDSERVSRTNSRQAKLP